VFKEPPTGVTLTRMSPGDPLVETSVGIPLWAKVSPGFRARLKAWISPGPNRKPIAAQNVFHPMFQLNCWLKNPIQVKLISPLASLI